ncbi:uncharacterized protein LOC129761628 [Toxorhynchites rutilus septentrionalis]|uniref:uncharacterized protein LOC129761628 n=1 Tax=Toxorhynchites rutilus septentrionalis TaxID=329112 RepID=UPI00247A9E04|nr:uncharacterized protein LOC129761628 [Toxorhynchites rutilus septentrionalis]
MSNLRALSRQERFYLDTMTNLKQYIENYNSNRDKNQLEGWKQRVETLYHDFQTNRLQIEVSSSEKADDDSEDETFIKSEEVNHNIRQQFENDYIYAYSFLATELRKTNVMPNSVDQSIVSAVSCPPSSPLSRIKLPEIRLPTFEGSVSEWITFRDTFKSLIDGNSQLSQIDKFSYLVASLAKDARKVIESVELTAANYSVAWSLLESRYDNKKLIVKTYIESLFAIESMRKENYESLMRLIDDFERNLCMIDKMGVPTDGWSVILAHMVCDRLDAATLRQCETHNKSNEVPTYGELIAFLKTHLAVLQSLPTSNSRYQESHKIEHKRSLKSRLNNVYTITNPTNYTCPFCSKSPHSPFKCEVFLKLSISQRFENVRSKNLCINCLSPSHLVRNCTSSSCRVCNQKHHTMLHQPSSDRSPTQSKPPTPLVQNIAPTNQKAQPNSSNQSSQRSVSSSLTQTPSASATVSSLASTTMVGTNRKVPATVLLQTAIVKVYNSNGQMQWARALLDPASQLSLITENLVQKLKLRRHPDRQEIGGVGNSIIVSHHTVVVRMGSHCTEFVMNEPCHVLRKITRDLPARNIDISLWNLPPHIVLADPNFDKPGPIDILIGMEKYYDLLVDGCSRITPEKAILQNTVLGWVVSGKVGNDSHPAQAPIVAHVCSSDGLDAQLSRFWELESCWSDSTHSVDENLCEEHFAATTFRNNTGRFVVTLPKRHSVLTELGNCEEIATRRFIALERRLNTQPALKKAYTAFIDEYLKLNHMREITNVEKIKSSNPTYFLPHHGVEKTDSTTTKLRVVFDASCRTETGISLNQALMVGPVVQDDLFSILLRFRVHRFAIIADIEKMYRQIRIHSSDYPLQQILWRSSSTESLRTFQLTTVTYGTASAPYLATKCLQVLSNQNSEEFPLAASVLAKDFYVDDLLSGMDDEEQGKTRCKDLINVLQSAGFSLRKWASNSATILSEIPSELYDERSIFNLDSNPLPIQTFGLQWEPSSDRFRYTVPKWSQPKSISRRIVISDAARLYDPLGLIGPVVVLAKILIQTLWRSSKNWDDPLDEDKQRYWFEFRNNLQDVSSISVPRWLICNDSPTVIEIHGFCDASEKAYGACLYLRTESINGIRSVLMTAKSKVAPLGDSKRQKRVCLPRLELSSALLLSHLYTKVKCSVPLTTESFFWTDSMITLHWLNAVPSRWKTFVANRVSEVHNLTADGIWSHVPGIDNPADVISRGMHATQLKDTASWWHGPAWLSQSSRFWPPLNHKPNTDLPTEILEEKPIALHISQCTPNEIFYLRSSFTALVRIIAFLNRFIQNCRTKIPMNRKIGFLQTNELDEATKILVRLAQAEVFSKDIAAIRNYGQVKENSELKSLFPIVIDSIMRVGGRLRNAAISEDRKHPIILPARHPLTECILLHYHLKNLHAGPQLLVACVRERYWPLRIRNLARKIVHNCINCYRCKPHNLDQLMGDLPPERVTPTLPFLNTGVDLCGPFCYRRMRKTAPVKCYVALFVCFVTKAVHVELVYDLSTAAFIAALHRFIARRGKPNVIQCDNAKNFKGAARELKELSIQFYSQQHQADVSNVCSNEGIEFKFIPPRSPNFGGLWEAAVKSLKRHLRSTIGNSILSQDEFVTLLARIEACLNSRPLTPLTTDPNDLEILTPGHFLVHRPLTSFPEPDLSEVPPNRLDRWQHNQELLRRIWKRWSTDYLSGLHPRTKWTQIRNNVTEGTMVLLKEDNLPPLKWKYGRITHIFRGDDNHIRVVTVRTATGEYRRSISKICVRQQHTEPTLE